MSNTRTAKPANIVFDQDDMTVGEMDDFYELTGFTLGVDSHHEVNGRLVPRPKVLTAIVCIVRRREDPEFTWEQARAEKVSSLSAAAVPASRRRPTAATKPSRSAPRSAGSTPATPSTA